MAILLALLVLWPTAALAELRVGTSGDYAPFSADGEGFDVEVARRIARDFDTELKWVPFRWPELSQAVARDGFDVAMSGVTWRPARAVVGWMSRAVAAGGPCVLWRGAEPLRIGVNRGGVLERWARRTYADREVVAVDDNRSLPTRLEAGEVDAIVTDSFELPHFRRPGLDVRCEPPRDRKVYWVAPARADSLGPRIDAWLAAHESELAELRRAHFGAAGARSEADHVLDLIARRMAFMPYVAAFKREAGVAIEDREREARVLASAAEQAQAVGLPAETVRAFFRLQIELAKAVQRRATAPDEQLDLQTQIRPALLRLGDRIVRSLAALHAREDRAALIEGADFRVLEPLLEPDEIAALRALLSR
jgi:chorismate mutase-like protein